MRQFSPVEVISKYAARLLGKTYTCSTKGG